MDETVEQNRMEALADSFSGLWTVFFATLGVVGIIGGTLLALSPAFGAEPGWVSENLRRIGIESGTFLTSGVICIGLSLISLRLQKVNGKLEAAQKTVERTEFLSLCMNQVAERMNILHAELCALKDTHAAGLRFIEEQSATEAVGMQVDATFRLASSIDQLGAKFEARLTEQAQEVQRCFGTLEEAVISNKSQLNHIQEAAESHQRAAASSTPVSNTESQGASSEEVEATWPGFEADALDTEPVLASADEFTEIELEVELEIQENDSGPVPDVASYDWEAVEIPEEHRSPDLGLLDEIELDDVATALPSPAPADAGLGLLDLLSEETSMNAPPEQESTPDLSQEPLAMRIVREEPDQSQTDDRDQTWDTFTDIG